MNDSRSTRPKIPASVWALGFVSLFTDIGSEMVHSLLPVLLAGTLGASALTIGLIEGAAESLVLITKVFSGYLSDAFGKRKPLVLLGYGLAAAVKPLFPLAGSVGTIVTARLLDRFGKGIRGAPRDALIADITPQEVRGAAFGLRQSMDSIGAVIGPLLAVGLMAVFLGNIDAVLWFAVVPGVIAVGLIVFVVREPAHVERRARLPISRAGLASLGKPFWMVVVVGGLLSLARFSEAFLILRGAQLGLSNTFVPLVLVIMSVVYTASAWPVGILSDRWSRRGLFAAGVFVLVLADGVFAVASGPLGVFVGAGLWGLHLGMTQGLLSTMVADTTPAAWRGTGFGVYSLVSGIALLVASVAAGALWDLQGAQTTFVVGGVFALLSVVALPLLGKAGHAVSVDS
ncbi:MAG TPA: MFS transporter [Dokdonella sp.]|uniref:MFS transporter n=1 Tax=Dokdonella sp. TaxID=2291710 RepID=UPI002C3D79C1|nr:MFS transporter [Dokdonella sp.]HOX72551.1 MFS transporter [Dokdonella sp.]